VFALPFIIALILLVYAHPQDFFESLRSLPLLYAFFGLALVGLALDLVGVTGRLRSPPQLPWACLLLVWSGAGALLRLPGEAHPHLTQLAICVALCALLAHGLPSLQALRYATGTILVLVLFVCAVGVHQGLAPTGCVVVDDAIPVDTSAGGPDGRPCVTAQDCYLDDPMPGADYACERVGLFGTTTVGQGRVRYLGVLQDPNELALAGAIGLPLAFASRRRGRAWGVVVGGTALAVVLICAVLTRSRTGQLVSLTVLAVYFARRFGVRGLVLAGALGLPLFLLGGRGGMEATRSTIERTECWAEALAMWRDHPVLGVGLGQFGQYHYLTAHNSYLLPLAELGLPGLLLFSVIFYLSSKIPLMALRHAAGGGFAHVTLDDERAATSAAMALAAAFAGLAVGLLFLSFTYHYVLWIYMGLSGALYVNVRRLDDSFRVALGWSDLLLVASADVALIALLRLYTHHVLG
jgi:O-antigen ligase